VDNSGLAPSDIGRNTGIFSLGQAIENIGGGVLVTGVMGFLFPIITLCYQGLAHEVGLTGLAHPATFRGGLTQEETL
jgi:hypothetical protein